MNVLSNFRKRIDLIDELIVELISKRVDICREVALYKKEHAIAMMQPSRVELILNKMEDFAAQKSIPVGLMRKLYETLIESMCLLEEEIISNNDLKE